MTNILISFKYHGREVLFFKVLGEVLFSQTSRKVFVIYNFLKLKNNHYDNYELCIFTLF